MIRAKGTLSRNTSRQLTASTITPPRNGPTRPEMPASDDQRPIARARSWCRNEDWMSARLPGVSSAPPMPCSARAATSCSMFWATPQISEAAANQQTPMTKTFRRP